MSLLKRNVWCVMMIVFFVSFTFTSDAEAYLPKGSEKADGAENILLVYSGYYDPSNYDGEEIGVWDRDKFFPYVGYLDDKGKPVDYFFDTFLFLGLETPTGGSLHRYYDWVEDSHPGTKEDWEWVINRMFVKNEQFDALNKAVRTTGARLEGNPHKQINVYMMLPFPDPQSNEFGDINGNGFSEDLSSLENRNLAVEWYIDTFLKRFNEEDYSNLNLSGFYWMQEDLDPSVPGEIENVQHTVDYLHEKGLKLGWIPWSGAGLKGSGNEHGFDFTIIQPNHYFNEDTTIDSIQETAELADSSKQGVEIEFDERVIESPWHRQALQNYLIGGLKYGYMENSLIAYYQDVYGLYNLYHHDNPIGQEIYNDIYQFTQGTYEAPMGSFKGRVVNSSGEPIVGTRIESDSQSTITDEYGNFHFDNLYATHQSFNIHKEGYQGKNVKVDIINHATVTKDIFLAQELQEGPEDTILTLDDFESDQLHATADNPSSISLNTEPDYVYEGDQSLKANFTTEFADFRVYLSADSAYQETNWSQYDSIKAEVFNPTDEVQYVALEFLDDLMSWGRSYSQRFELEPNRWTTLEIPIAEMATVSNFNVKDVRRMSFAQRINSPYKLPNTLYIDNVRLVDYAQNEHLPSYFIDAPTKSSSLDIRQSLQLTVRDRSIVDEDGRPIIVDDATFSSSNSDVVSITPEGFLVASQPGEAMIRATVENIEVESWWVEVSEWDSIDLNPQSSVLEVGQTSRVTARASFANGFSIPYDEAEITWNIEGDAIHVTEESNEIISIEAVEKGNADVNVSIRYNNKELSQQIRLKVK